MHDKPRPRGADLAAVVLVTLGESLAGRVLRHLDERTIGTISDSMAKLKSVNRETVALAMGKLAFDRDSAGVNGGGFDFLRRVLLKEFGEHDGQEMLDRIMRSGNGALDALSTVDPKTLAEQIGNERPQVLAVIVGHMARSSAVTMLSQFPEEVTFEVIYRYACLETVQPVALQELRAMLTETLGGHIATRTVSPGGVRQAGDLLNGMDAATSQKALEAIRQINPAVADQIRESMFTFEDLLRLSDDAMQIVIREFQMQYPDRLDKVLRNASDEMCKMVYRNISTKQRTVLQDQIENGKALTRADVQHARRDFVNLAIALAAENRIALGGTEDMI